MLKQDLVNRIREYFDLNIYETKVWLALLTKGMATAGEISKISSVPRSRTYDVLESLEKRGFAITKIGKPLKYIATKPDEVIEKIKIAAIQTINDKIKTLSALKNTAEYEELENLYRAAISPIKIHEMSGIFKGRLNILSKLRDLISNAKKEILILTSTHDLEDKSRVLMPLLAQAAQKEIKIKLALFGNTEKIKKINLKHNIKIFNSSHDAKIYIIDKNEILFMIVSNNSEEEIAVWLNSPYFVSSFSNMLEQNIEQKTPNLNNHIRKTIKKLARPSYNY